MNPTRRQGRQRGHPSKRGSALRYAALLIVAGLLTGCASDVVMLNPRTGETITCSAGPLNPWSQQQACIGDHVTQGWRRQE